MLGSSPVLGSTPVEGSTMLLGPTVGGVKLGMVVGRFRLGAGEGSTPPLGLGTTPLGTG